MKVLAVASAVLAATVSAKTCDITALTAQFGPIILDANKCQAVSGYTLVPPTALPTPEQLQKVCSGCPDLIKKVSGMAFPDCEIQFGAEPISVKDLFASLGDCGSKPTPASSPAATPASSPAATPASSPAASSAAPAASSEAPVVTEATAGSLSGSTTGSVDAVVTDAPEAGSPEASAAPAPTKKSAAVVSTVGVAAVAASIAAVMAA